MTPGIRLVPKAVDQDKDRRRDRTRMAGPGRGIVEKEGSPAAIVKAKCPGRKLRPGRHWSFKGTAVIGSDGTVHL